MSKFSKYRSSFEVSLALWSCCFVRPFKSFLASSFVLFFLRRQTPQKIEQRSKREKGNGKILWKFAAVQEKSWEIYVFNKNLHEPRKKTGRNKLSYLFTENLNIRWKRIILYKFLDLMKSRGIDGNNRHQAKIGGKWARIPVHLSIQKFEQKQKLFCVHFLGIRKNPEPYFVNSKQLSRNKASQKSAERS